LVTLALGEKYRAHDINALVRNVYESFEKNFPHRRFTEFVDEWHDNLKIYANTSASTGYKTVEGQVRCSSSPVEPDALAAVNTRRVTPLPGSASVPVMGMSLVGKALHQLERAEGPAAAQATGVAMLAKTALEQVKGVIQTVVAVVATDVPPTVPPPVWNNLPFPCMPMVTGHNCFGAVLYPITIGDFIMADVTDSALDGVVSSFPSYYRSHIGTTDDGTYNRCFKAYMSMQCANAFPTCTTVQASELEIPFLGRGPMCFLHCIATLIACPGMWVDDLEDICMHVSAPPVCSFAAFAKDAPAQLSTGAAAEPTPMNCPRS